VFGKSDARTPAVDPVEMTVVLHRLHAGLRFAPMNELTPAVFLDRDGTLMHDTGYVGDPASVQIYPGVSEALATLKAAGFKTIIVTNQSGIPRGYFTEEDFQKVQARFEELIGPGLIDAVYYCAEHPDHATERRKPGPGMLREGARDHAIDLTRSWMIGDRAGDVEAGVRAGVRSILVRTGEGAGADGSGAAHVAESFVEAVNFIIQKT
jgi:D,D-heptose 1,7-bisphosphate phosphatase